MLLKFRFYFLQAILLALFACPINAYSSSLSGYLGGSIGYGSISNPPLGLPNRAISESGLYGGIGWEFAEWRIGPTFGYRWLHQQTALSQTNNTNLTGKAFLLGAGLDRFFSERWAAHLSVGFLGQHSFTYATSGHQSDHLSSPFALKAALHYFPWSDRRPWSIDLAFEFINWRRFQVEELTHHHPTRQLMTSIGVNYHFQLWKGTPIAESAPPLLEPIEETTPGGSNMAEKKEPIANAHFSYRSSKLKAADRNRLCEIAPTIAGKTLLVTGHADDRGPPERNTKISLRRAERVKEALVACGMEPGRIKVRGMSSAEPIADNSSAEGRALNRRVTLEMEGGNNAVQE